MKVAMNIDYDQFSKSLESKIRKVLRGTKKATKAACEEILADSIEQVPKDTATLAQSAYYEILGKYKNFEAIIGYGGNGDPVNPTTGQPASSYMVAVHEDLSANHPVGKAKFLEDPIRAYEKKLKQTVSKHINEELK